MKELWPIAIRAILGGTAVCIFAMVGEMVDPKKFAGIFAAAPAVAIASLAITIATKGPDAAHPNALGMMAGAVGMFVYCMVAVQVLRRLHALMGALVVMPVWGAVAGGGLFLLTR